MRTAVLCVLAAAASATTETMTLCLNCTKTDQCAEDTDKKTFEVPVGRCFNPLDTWPDDGDVWGEFDVLDECGDRILTRSFFSSTDGSCSGDPTDSYKLEYDTCLGPFGAPRPWGVFECS